VTTSATTAASGPDRGNVRYGSSGKTVCTDVGEVRINVPRDRAGTFTQLIVLKHARRLTGFDDAVLSLYAKGLTTGDIANHLADIYGTEVSRDLVSRVTHAIVEDMQQWQSGRWAWLYPCRRQRGPRPLSWPGIVSLP